MKCAIKYNFPIHDINKFILFLRKDVYPFEYIDDWKIFNESLLRAGLSHVIHQYSKASNKYMKDYDH